MEGVTLCLFDEGNHAITRVENTSGKFSTSEIVIQVGAQNNIPICQLSNR